MAIQLFMQATIILSNYYGFKTIQYSEIQARSARAGFNTLPFMPPETVRATPELVNLANNYENNPEMLNFLINKYGYKALVKYYVRTGLRASQMVCRNYLLGLEEGNQYLEFLRREFGVAYALATGILQLTHANATLQGAFLVSRTAVDGGLTAYEEYRFMNIDREAARVLVETAQNKYAEYFALQVDKASTDPNAAAGGYTFSDALHAVNTIEYQCTRQGIRALLNRSINNSPTNLEIDATTGTFLFKSTLSEGRAATGRPPAASGAVSPMPVPVPEANVTPQQGTNKPSSNGTGAKPGGGTTAVLSSRDILRNFLGAGNADAQRSRRIILQDALEKLLSNEAGRALMPIGVVNVQIEDVVSTRRPETDFEGVRMKLLEIARDRRLIP